MATTRDTRLTIFDDLPQYLEVDGHHDPAAVYVQPEHLSGFPLTIAAVDAAELVDQPIADLHEHAVDELYLAVTPGLRFAVETDQGVVEVDSPVSVRIPAGVRHRFVVREATVRPCVFVGMLVGTPHGGKTASSG